MRSVFVFFILTFAAEAATNLKIKKSDSVSVQKAKAKLNALRTEIEATEQTMTGLEKVQKDLAAESEKSEKDFRSQFEKVLVPLLNWPQVPLAEKTPSWIERDHLKAVLFSLRARLLKEPLELMAARQLKLKQTDDLQESQMGSLKALQSRHGILLLQLEELLAMEKREKNKRETLLKSSGDPRKHAIDSKNPAQTEGLGPL